MSKLVIVESPAKVKKIKGYLPDGYLVDSSVGHVRDLPSKKSELPEAVKDKPWADYAVDVDGDFDPVYVTIRGKGKVITQLRKQLKEVDELLLATDEDREGESIAWHLVQALKPKVPVRRMVFNEITKKAVLEALENTREMDHHLVEAQETRRILDRLYGYGLSPLLWKKVGGNLSAGRVQSVAVRLAVLRERERMAFVAGSYWDLTGHLDAGGPFEARLTHVDGRRIATGRDFNPDTGRIQEGVDVLQLEEPAARDLASRCQTAPWKVTDVTAKPRSTRPFAPFITSTLQQEANNRLNLSAREAMRLAQRLYENGFITYMRTDSTSLSDEALQGAKAAVLAEFGDRYYAGPRRWDAKKSKGAQEAHEAIRPAGEEFQHPDRCGLSGKEQDLYRLIWQRTLASQMAEEKATLTTVTLAVEEATFVATGKAVDFPGWRAVYPQRRKDATDASLPAVKEGDEPRCSAVDAEGHETQPPARFTEATLVRALEEEGIGRPSTYASIIDTIVTRGYVTHRGKSLVPTFTGFAVTGLLEKHFPHLVDTRFTAHLEDDLDRIASGETTRVPVLASFWRGDGSPPGAPDGRAGLAADVAYQMEAMDPAQARVIDLPIPYTVKTGRFGPYVEVEHEGERVSASLPEDVTPADLDAATVERLILAKTEGPQSLGKEPASGLPVYLLEGRYGPYYQLGQPEDLPDGGKPKRASLPKTTKPDDATLEEALFLLSLPLTLGPHPEGGNVLVGLGRFGPYVAHDRGDGSKPEYRSLPKGQAMDEVTHESALALLAQPKAGRGRGPSVLKELGADPASGKPVRLLDGRYGPYVQIGEGRGRGKNAPPRASLPKGADPEATTLESALALIKARQEQA